MWFGICMTHRDIPCLSRSTTIRLLPKLQILFLLGGGNFGVYIFTAVYEKKLVDQKKLI